MHEQCGKKINLKWESIFAARIELRPSTIFVNQNGVNEDRSTTYKGGPQLECELTIETWDFQNRMMVNFEELELGNDTGCTGSNMEILDGPDRLSPQLTGTLNIFVFLALFQRVMKIIFNSRPQKEEHDNPSIRMTTIDTFCKIHSIYFQNITFVSQHAVETLHLVHF